MGALLATGALRIQHSEAKRLLQMNAFRVYASCIPTRYFETLIELRVGDLPPNDSGNTYQQRPSKTIKRQATTCQRETSATSQGRVEHFLQKRVVFRIGSKFSYECLQLTRKMQSDTRSHDLQARKEKTRSGQHQ